VESLAVVKTKGFQSHNCSFWLSAFRSLVPRGVLFASFGLVLWQVVELGEGESVVLGFVGVLLLSDREELLRLKEKRDLKTLPPVAASSSVPSAVEEGLLAAAVSLRKQW